MTFELLKEYLLERYDGMPPPWAILGAGMTSSSIAQFASYPLALVRTRMQVGTKCHACTRGVDVPYIAPVSEPARALYCCPSAFVLALSELRGFDGDLKLSGCCCT